jgi:hypothetical protein
MFPQLTRSYGFWLGPGALRSPAEASNPGDSLRLLPYCFNRGLAVNLTRMRSHPLAGRLLAEPCFQELNQGFGSAPVELKRLPKQPFQIQPRIGWSPFLPKLE